MKRKLLAWLLLMILSSLAITNGSFQLEHCQGDVGLSRLQGQETIHGVPGTVRLNRSEEDDGSGSSKEQGDLLVASEKGQKGKTGVYGGGNSSHRPKSSATPSPYLMAKTMLHVIFSSVLIHSFKLL
ncbi:PREDICTED: uncharacterized protein LOC101298143 [Fragaria vesca subsp. vesca]